MARLFLSFILRRKMMLSRIHDKSDILESGRIMLSVDCEPGCYTLTDLEYSEHALREVLVENHKAIQEAMSTKHNFTFDVYINILASLTNNLKIITESLLAVKARIQANNGEQGTSITESFTREIVEYSSKKA
jgi:hypothetical protein